MSKGISTSNPPTQRGGSNGNDFDFDQWASQVKRQMIACLRRRGAI